MFAGEHAETAIRRALFGFSMSARQPGPYDSIARKWLALAERRRAHVIELRDSGRWKHYYTTDGLDEAMRKAARGRDAWVKVVGLPPRDTDPSD